MVKLYLSAFWSKVSKIIDEERCRLAYNRSMRQRSDFHRAIGISVSQEERDASYAAFKEKWRQR